MPRFFVTEDSVNKDAGEITIIGDDARHIARSLRMAVGDEITVCDGSSMEYSCVLSYIRDEECRCSISAEALSSREPESKISLYMAYPKGDKMETIIQKAVELGASTIVPFESSRCIKRPKAEKIDKLTARLNRIAEEAAKQCGRAVIPKVTEPLSFKEAMSRACECELPLFCYECEDKGTLRGALEGARPSTIAVIVGAEGGFSQDEAEYAVSLGAKKVSLGKRILRCETAPLFTLSAICYELELR